MKLYRKSMKKVNFLVVAILVLGTVGVNAQTIPGIQNITVAQPGVAVYPGKTYPTYPIKNRGIIQLNNLTIQSIVGDNITATRSNIIPMNGSKNAYPGQPDCYIPGNGVQQLAIACLPNPSTSYDIKVSAITKIMLQNRTITTLADFSAGDRINVYGRYNSDGSIQAYIIRNISKVSTIQTVQLNHVTLTSISGNTLTIVVNRGYPCFASDVNGVVDVTRVCPLGNDLSSRVYIVSVDSSTLLLDRNRTIIPLSSIKAGDILNINGDVNTANQTIKGRFVRDLSIPSVRVIPMAMSLGM